MKRITGIAVLVLLVAAAPAQTKAPVKKKPVATAAHTPTTLRSSSDSLSYAIGMSLANFYKQQGIKSVNTVMVDKAINDVLKNGKAVLTDEQMNMCITGYLQKEKTEKASLAKKAGETFLAENKKKPGVVTLPSGLQYMILKKGDGPIPTAADTVRCHYHGTLIDGTVFDSSVERGQPAEFPVTGVIQGWVEALQLMPVGSKWRLFIPSNMAYGDNQMGPKIAPGSTLVFEVELLEIVKK
ncbi:MAG TPA: FKBP-type peptidyl-prolyl cis-trans isomerase [Chitinophagaceae bacterium]|jgi:FKBP-type peptidyl-prolyl cis-trans isomerase FklB